MRFAISLVIAIVALGAAPGVASEELPSRLLVTADEWSLALSRTKIAAGDSIVELYNRGEDAHDVRIKRAGRSNYVPIPETGSEQSNRIETRFKGGKRYVLWCSLEGHRALGMEAELRVTRASSAGTRPRSPGP